VLLDRRHDDPYITMQLYAAGFVTGRVLDHAGLPAEGLAVALRSLAGDDPARETACDVLGWYRFDEVLDGEYELRFGPPERPLLPVQRLRFAAPSMTIPDRELPMTSRLAILAVDDYEVPVPDARVRGSGDAGVFDVTTDATGRAEARYLRLGRYRVGAEHEQYGRARVVIDVTAAPQDLRLHLPPPR
jgi:5-hydroxyisourate hydrolase-like protein (transthyretin family)